MTCNNAPSSPSESDLRSAWWSSAYRPTRGGVVSGVGRIHRVDEVQDFVRGVSAAGLVDHHAQRRHCCRQARHAAQRRAAHVDFQRQIVNVVGRGLGILRVADQHRAEVQRRST